MYAIETTNLTKRRREKHNTFDAVHDHKPHIGFCNCEWI